MMNTINDIPAVEETPLEKLGLALEQESGGGKSKLEMDFREAYTLFAQHLARKMRKRTLMDRFNDAYEHTLNLVQFRKLLNAERDRREASGDLIECAACGQPLSAYTSVVDTREDME